MERELSKGASELDCPALAHRETPGGVSKTEAPNPALVAAGN